MIAFMSPVTPSLSNRLDDADDSDSDYVYDVVGSGDNDDDNDDNDEQLRNLSLSSSVIPSLKALLPCS